MWGPLPKSGNREGPCNECGTIPQTCSNECFWVDDDDGARDDIPGQGVGPCEDNDECTAEECLGDGTCAHYQVDCCDGFCDENEDDAGNYCDRDCCGNNTGCTGDEGPELCTQDCT